MRFAAVLAATAALLAVGLLGHPPSALARSCGGADHTITSGKDGLLIVREHAVSCRTATRLGLYLLQRARIRPHHPARVDGFVCADRRPAGEIRCSAPGRWVLFDSM